MDDFNYLIDSHSHLHDLEFFEAEMGGKLVEKAREAGVKQLVVIGTNTKDSWAAEKFAKRHRDVWWTFGIHPHELAAEREKIDLKKEKLVAIGEVGLDYHWTRNERNQQIKLFEEMLELAEKYELPVVFHIREAFEDFLAVMRNWGKIRGVVHSFSDSRENLERVVEAGYYVGVNGLATFAEIPLAPLERIMLETDAPFLAPIPYRGKQNQPAYVKEVAEFLAGKLGVSLEEVRRTTTRNTRELFRLESPSSDD